MSFKNIPYAPQSFWCFIFICIVYISGCGSKNPDYDDAYNECVDSISAQAQKLNNGSIPEDMNRKMAEASCKLIKTECEQNPDSQLCKQLLEQYDT